MGINFINPDKQTGEKDFSVVEKGDVVVLPAFGASLEEMQVCVLRTHPRATDMQVPQVHPHVG
jgi:hypothetical protein